VHGTRLHTTASSSCMRIRRPSALAAQSLRLVQPRQGQGPVAGAAEFVICDHTIEQRFRDDTSGGFALGQTKLDDPARIGHILLAVAIATLPLQVLAFCALLTPLQLALRLPQRRR
jgi:hypothetical protein